MAVRSSMPKQLGFEQGFHERGAIDRHKRTLPPGAQLVDLPGHELFAHTALAFQRPLVERGAFLWIYRRIGSDRGGGNARKIGRPNPAVDRRSARISPPRLLIRACTGV